MNDKIPIWLKKVNQNIPITKPRTTIIKLTLFNDNADGIKFIKEYCEGIKFAIKFVEIEAIAIKTKAKIIKNRMGPPLRVAEFEIYFDSGVDDFGGWLTALKNHKLISQGGSWYTYTDANGEAHKFLSKDWNALLEKNDELREEVYNKICDATIMEYKTDNLGIDDIELSTEPVPEG